MLTLGGWAAQKFLHFSVGGVLAQGTHDVGHLVESNLGIANSVEQTEGFLEVWRMGERGDVGD